MELFRAIAAVLVVYIGCSAVMLFGSLTLCMIDKAELCSISLPFIGIGIEMHRAGYDHL